MDKTFRRKFVSAILTIAALLFTAIAFFACGGNSAPTVDFIQNGQVTSELILSKNSPVDFSNYIQAHGIKPHDVNFEISDKDVYTLEDGVYTFTQSSHTMIFAKKNQQILGSASLVIKAQFPAPSVLTMDDQGVLHWDESSTIENGQTISANDYTLTINGEEQPIITGTSFDLQQYVHENGGSDFVVSVCANGLKYVDASESSPSFNFYLPSLAQVELTNFVASSGNINLQWTNVEHATYNLYLDNVSISRNLVGTSYVIDFSMIEGGEQVEVTIEASARGYISSRKTITVKKLETPVVQYIKENGNLSWEESENNSFVLTHTNLDTKYTDSEILSDCSTRLENLPRGVYSITVMAQGSQNADNEHDLYYANSDNSQEQIAAKLQLETPTYSIVGSVLTIDLDEDDYIENYTLYYGDKIINWNTKNQTNKLSVNLSDLGYGEQKLKLIARPTLEEGDIKPYPSEGNDQDNIIQVLNSDEIVLPVHVLNAFGDVVHSLQDGSSLLSFSTISNATHYKVTINDSSEQIIAAQDGETQNLKIGNLSLIEPDGSSYRIRIEAYNEDQHSINSNITKILKVLPQTTEAETQSNGYYSWNPISNASYYYEIYQVDKNFLVGGVLNEVKYNGEGQTIENIIRNNEKLPFGYYVIRVYTRSNDDNNEYLAADFYDKSSFLEKKFHVYERITAPELSYDIDSSILTINTVDHAYEYVISVNDEPIEISLKNESMNAGAVKQYEFTGNIFKAEGSYKIKVVAKAGEKNDATLFPDSEASGIEIIRLPQPALSNGNIEQNGENLTLLMSKPENCKDVKLSIDGQQTELDENLRTDISNKTEFTAHIEFLAKESSQSVYYLGNQNDIYVKRISTPSRVEYSNGMITFECENSTYVDHYIIEIEIHCVGDTFTITEQTKTNNFNLQELLDTQKVVDLTQMKNITVRVIAYQCDTLNIGGSYTFFVPSYYGQTQDGAKKLDLERLASPIINYNTTLHELSWEAVGDNGQTKYAVYIDGKLKEGNLSSTSYKKWDGVDFLTAKKIYIVASNSHYLDSSNSNEIWVKKLNAPEKLNVFKGEGNIYKASLSSSESGRIKNVILGSKGELQFTQEGIIVFNIEDYVQENEIKVQYTAADHVNNYYYEDSAEIAFKLVNLSTKNLEHSIDNGKIYWNNVTGDSFDHVIYTIVITDDAEFKKEISTYKTEFALDETDFVSITTGEYNVVVKATVADYELYDEQGYFGACESAPGKISKLSPVGEIQITIEDGNIEGATKTQNKVEFVATLGFEDIWSDEVEFEVTINANESLSYSLSAAQGNYKLEIDQSHFKEGANDLRIVVKSKTAIMSNESVISIMRYPQVSSLQISKDGIVSFEGDCKNYLVMLTFDNEHYVYENITGNSHNLMEKFADNYGSYTIEVVGYDEENKILPSVSVAKFNGLRLAGIESTNINGNGEVEITLSDKVEIDNGIIFEARYGEQSIEFEPRQRDGTSIFVYTMIEFVRDFKIENEGQVSLLLNVRKENNVSAKEQSCSFEYVKENSSSDFARGRNYADDYFKFDYIKDTTAFNVQVTYYENELYTDATHVETIFLSANSHFGYWIETTDEDGNELKYFTNAIPADLKKDAKTESCYAISLNDLLKDQKQLFYQVAFSRIVKEETIKQYSEKVLPIEKLASAGTLTLREGVLNWSKSRSENAQAYYVYFLDKDGDKETYFKQTSNNNLNLTLENLAPGSSNYLSVVAVSKTIMSGGRYIIASDEATNDGNRPVYKHTTPTKIVVEDGKLLFDPNIVENSEFFKAIKNNYNASGEQFLKLIYESTFTDVYTLTPREFETANIRLRFETANNVYFTTVKAIELLPSLKNFEFDSGDGVQINYLKAFNDKFDSVTNENNEFKINLQSFHDAIQSVDGIADDEMLFDEFGALIPSGLYNLKIQQVGSDSSWQLESEFSDEAQAAAVTRAPEITLDDKYEGDQTHYLVKFKPVLLQNDSTKTQLASNYTIRMQGDSYTYWFKVVYDQTYKITSVTRKDSTSSLSFSDLDFDLEQNNELVVVDITNLLKLFKQDEYQEHGQDVRFIKTGGYQFTIYAQGNNYSISSKNESVTVNLLGLNASDIHLDEGVLYWTTAQQFENLSTAVRYCRSEMQGEKELETPIQFVDGRATLSLPANLEGYFQYIILYIKGGRGESVLNVDSDRYMIQNVFKQQKPDVSLAGNYFTLPVGAPLGHETDAKYYTNNYKIENNADDEILMMSSAQNGQNQYWPTKENASEYYITRLGNSSEFNVIPSAQTEADYILSFTNTSIEGCILSAERQTYYAKMIKSVSDVQTNVDGDVEWKGILSEDGHIEWAGTKNTFEPFTLSENQLVVYKVSVYTGDDIASATLQATYFTSTTKFDTIKLTELELKDGISIIFKITAHIYNRTDSSQLTTLEGDQIEAAEVSISVGVGGGTREIALSGLEVVLSEVDGAKIKQASKPTNVTTRQGQLVWNVDESVYCSGILDVNNNQYYTIENQGITELSYLPKLTYSKTPYTLQVFTYGGEQNRNLIKSKAVTASTSAHNTDVYKLPNIQDGDFEITQDSKKIIISFANLLENKKVLGSTDYYVIKLTLDFGSKHVELYSKDILSGVASTKHEDFVLYTNENQANESFHECKLGEPINSITYQVIDNQTSQEIMTINGEEATYDDLTYNGNFSAEWDSANYRFNFTSDQENLLFEIALNYRDGQSERAELSGEYYEPKIIGTITDFSLRARKPNAFYTPSKTSSGRWDYNIFAGGLGTSEKPYQIETAAQFANMIYRNTTNHYFILKSDITLQTLNGFAFNDAFLGNLNGDGKTITASITAHKLESAVSDSFPVSENEVENVNFDGAGAIFRQIGLSRVQSGANGSIINLKLKTDFVYSTMDNLNYQLLSGLTLYNYGSISDITITSSTTQCAAGASLMAQSGLVGYNYKTISDCSNEADITINAISADVIFAGLVLSNNIFSNDSFVTRCFNNGEININLNSSRNNRAWVSGVVLKSYSSLSQSGNNASITMGGNGNISRRIVCGVCLDSSGTLEYCFNNGTISATNTADDAIGGVSYMLSAGHENYLVDTTSLRISLICNTFVSTRDTNYTDSQITTSNLPTRNVPSILRQDCAGGHFLVIENGKASII